MRTGQNGLTLIKSFEQCRLNAYLDATLTPTIGWGHTGGVVMGTSITQAQADAYLAADLATAENAINKQGLSLNQNQFDALVSLLFNCGTGVLTNFIADIKAKNWDAVTTRMEKYHFSKGISLNGLITRRAAEIELFKKKNTMTNIDYVILTVWLILGALIAYKIFN